MKKYRLESYGQLLLSRVAVGGRNGLRVVKLLIDTGSSYTILPFDILEAIGSEPSVARDRVRITTGSGYLIAPIVSVDWFNALGCKLTDFRVVAHTLPFGTFVDGLLGIDFLVKADAVVRIVEKTIDVLVKPS